ncbi:hypothetical protein [Microvirga lotononidis]|uniref:Uncharacterized protein n=1 Tax=Microvirga lotononidis TaxID=864069 RepID=I4Z3Q8_9HYPH|nr:hypothetical protein [Microvirga lotononidis]EIM30850.1 hypothetical protein MicloDRAFT_00003770 [Microvirga lotononidis]WQO31785.1 hypothetical protein U0023_31010 [Microvirga lotononidis]
MLMQTPSRSGGHAIDSNPISLVEIQSFEAPVSWLLASAYQQDLVEFLLHRWRKDIQAAQDLSACRRWSDLVAAQFKWAWEAQQDHRTVLGKILFRSWRVH